MDAIGCCVALALACTACGGPYTLPLAPPPPQGVSVASDGQIFSGTDTESKALEASGAHDLGCPIGEVAVQNMIDQYGKPKLVVEGCGRRAVYFWNTINTAPSTYEHHAVLEGIVPLTPPAPK
jgi:hypothetical protein